MNSRNKIFIAALIVSIIFSQSMVMGKSRFKPDWESLSVKKNVAPEWLRDAKFGIYTHWGPQTWALRDMEADKRWMYPTDMYIPDRPLFEYHKKTYGDQKEVGWKDLIDRFKAPDFDPKLWAKTFHDAGARFCGFVMFHRDNVAMYDSDVTPWNMKKMGPKRDIGGELAAAYRELGMRFMASFHHIGVWNQEFKNVYKYDADENNPLHILLYGEKRNPKAPASKRFVEYIEGTITEVIDKYLPDAIYFDYGFGHMMPDNSIKSIFAHYYNSADEKGKGDDVVFIHKNSMDQIQSGIKDTERGWFSDLRSDPWFHDTSIGKGCWFYYPRSLANTGMFDSKFIIQKLADIVSKNGHFVLNIAPDHNGNIPQEQLDLLKDVGKWLKKYGKAIYLTRPWKTFGEGPHRLRFSGWLPEKKPSIGDFVNQDIRFTRSKDNKTVYAIFLGPPEDGITINAMKSELKEFNAKWIGYGDVKIDVDKNKHPVVRLDPSKAANDKVSQIAYVIEFSSDRIVYDPSVEKIIPKKVEALAENMKIHGDTIAFENEPGNDLVRFIGNWKNTDDYVSIKLQLPEAGMWALKIRVASRHGAPIPVKYNVGKKSGSGIVKRTVKKNIKNGICDLGMVDIENPGEYNLTLRSGDPVANWKPIDIYSIILQKVGQ